MQVNDTVILVVFFVTHTENLSVVLNDNQGPENIHTTKLPQSFHC